MSWFSRKKSGSVESPAPLTVERVDEALRRLGWECKREDANTMAGQFNGYTTVFDIQAEGACFVVVTWAPPSADAENRLPEATVWANNWNADSVYGTAYPYLDEGELLVRVDASFYTRHGVTDEQLDLFIHTGVTSTVQSIEDYVSKLPPIHPTA